MIGFSAEGQKGSGYGAFRLSGEAGQGPIVTEHFLVKGSHYRALFDASYGAVTATSAYDMPAFAELRR